MYWNSSGNDVELNVENHITTEITNLERKEKIRKKRGRMQLFSQLFNSIITVAAVGG